jgi:dolichyl-phosphate beta-glucosyltransferase
MVNQVLIVIPVFNEFNRWDDLYFAQIAKETSHKCAFLFVNDGSTDKSLNLIEDFCAQSDEFEYLSLPQNMGKSEATRIGMLKGFESGYSAIGFLDADGAFEVGDVARIVDVYLKKCSETSEIHAIWSSRLGIAGRKIKRSGKRHFAGRLVSKLICLFVDGAPWDTQSGLKIFRAGDEFFAAIQKPFDTKWFFELEILQRHRRLSGTNMLIWEEPVDGWTDITGSKIRIRNFPSILLEIMLIVYKNISIFRVRHRSDSN